MPTAQRSLLPRLAAAGVALHHHSEFDWRGIAIGNHVMGEFGALLWRFGAKDDLVALAVAPKLRRLLTATASDATRDVALGFAMQQAARVIEAEMVADDLLRDLRERVL